MQYLVERLSPAHLEHLQALYRSTYRKNVSLASLAGKYNTKLFGAEWLGYFAVTSQHQPVAFYGLIPCHFKIGGEAFLAAQAVDAMTHPGHRNKGLFQHLVKKTHELAEQEGVQFVFGFPNQNSYGGLVKANWKFIDKTMQLFILKGSKFPWAKLLLKIPLVKNLFRKLTEDGSVPRNDLDILSYDHGVVRDPLFLRHKDQYTRTFVKKWGNVSAWMKNDGALKIGLLTFDPLVSPLVIENHLKEAARQMGCRSVVLMTSVDTQLYKTLKTLAPPRKGLPVGFYNLTTRDIDFEKAVFEYCDIDIF